jgi:hypothetical protein
MRQIIVSDLQRPIYGLILNCQNLDCGIIVAAIGNKPGSFGLGNKCATTIIFTGKFK